MNKIEEKFEKVKEWAKKPYNTLLIVLFVALVIYRLYWFFKVGNQALWWDEAEYMNMANTLAGNYHWDIDAIRPMLLPFIMFLIFKIGLGETTIRLLLLVVSISAVVLTYLVGKTLFDKKAGLISAVLLAVFWSFSFYSYRVLVDIPVVFFWLATIYVLFDAYQNNKGIWNYVLAGIMMGLAFLTKFSSMALVGAITVYLVTTERTNIIRNKKIILFYLASFLTLVPFLIWNYAMYNSPIAFYTKVMGNTPTILRSFFQSLIDQTFFSIKLIKLVPIVLFALGAILFVGQMFILYDRVLKKDTKQNKIYFVLLWLVVALIFFGRLNYGDYMDERYYFVFYPAIFLIAASGLLFIYGYIEKYSRIIGAILIIAVLCFAAYPNIKDAGSIIEAKKQSFSQIRTASEWINENAEGNRTLLIVEERASILYYTKRDCVLVTNITNLNESINKYNPEYILVSFYYGGNFQSKNFVDMVNYIFSSGSRFTPVKSYIPYVDPDKRVPIATVFKIA